MLGKFEKAGQEAGRTLMVKTVFVEALSRGGGVCWAESHSDILGVVLPSSESYDSYSPGEEIVIMAYFKV